MRALRLCREHSAMSLTDLSEASGVDRGTIWKVEMGIVSPSVRTLERMVAPLGVSVAQVLAAEVVLAGQREKALQTK
ncbi:MAG: helix-turn-helix domain-containing protein [Actinomycetota bacterium]|nr:helix-turn-helix domain-containing protein [Actinomycetota bacterium]